MQSSEASLHALLGRLFAAEIDGELLAVLRTPPLRDAFEEVEPSCLEGIDAEAAASEYCRLFVLPGGVPAVAAAWLPGSDPNKSAAIVGLVLNLQSALDLSLPGDLPPDHAGTLLSLMAWLLEYQCETARDFQTVALDPWLGQFATALGEETTLPLYRATSAILASLYAATATDRSIC